MRRSEVRILSGVLVCAAIAACLQGASPVIVQLVLAGCSASCDIPIPCRFACLCQRLSASQGQAGGRQELVVTSSPVHAKLMLGIHHEEHEGHEEIDQYARLARL